MADALLEHAHAHRQVGWCRKGEQEEEEEEGGGRRRKEEESKLKADAVNEEEEGYTHETIYTDIVCRERPQRGGTRSRTRGTFSASCP